MISKGPLTILVHRGINTVRPRTQLSFTCQDSLATAGLAKISGWIAGLTPSRLHRVTKPPLLCLPSKFDQAAVVLRTPKAAATIATKTFFPLMAVSSCVRGQTRLMPLLELRIRCAVLAGAPPHSEYIFVRLEAAIRARRGAAIASPASAKIMCSNPWAS